MGGGFGPVLRTRAVLAAMGWDRDAVAVLAAPGAERVAGDLELIAPSWDDAADPAALGRWVARVVAEREADALLVDALPGGVMGELCGLGALDGLGCGTRRGCCAGPATSAASPVPSRTTTKSSSPSRCTPPTSAPSPRSPMPSTRRLT